MPLMPRRLNDPGNDNWCLLWESNSLIDDVQWLGSDGYTVASMVPLPTSDSSDTVAMTSNPVIRLLEDQFLHWC